uniref:ABC-type xenobiotic transporter n=1 Tax=Salvia miltiorrhiza TaxID=226208 RepID=A0A8E7D981_SALMI|nr:ABC transporter [Salvia miltiorrhiza]
MISTDLRFLRFQVAWPEMISPCHWEDASIIMQLGFLVILLLYCIRKNLDFFRKGRKNPRDVEKYPTNGRYGFSYKVSIICSILMLSTQVVTLLTWQQSQCGSEVSVLSSRIMQVISWAITLFVLYRIRSRKRLKFPWILRFWWTSSFLLSLVRVMIDAHCLVTDHNQLGVQEYGDMIDLAASVCLLILSIREVKRDNPYGKATFIQLVTFSWLNPLFEFGFKKPLDPDEVPDVDIKDSAAFLSQDFDQCLKRVKERDGSDIPSLYKAMYIFARKKAAINALFAITNAGASYESWKWVPSCIRLPWSEAGGDDSTEAVDFRSPTAWPSPESCFDLSDIQKGPHLVKPVASEPKQGEIINYMSVDVQRITDFIWYLNTVWMLPVQISLAIFILHINLGNGALVGLAATLTVMAGNIPLTRIQKRYQTKIMDAKDNRMKSTSEVLRHMKTLKLQAWDSHYLLKLIDLRKIEHNWLWKSLRLSALTAFIFWGSPTFISVITFGGCVLMGIPLTAGRVLSALATFRMLQDPIFNLPDLLNVIAQGKVSVDRISSYLQEDEIKPGAVEFIANNETELHVEIDGGVFSWDMEQGGTPILNHIQLKVKKGMKVAICGTVGSGKSSLLSCILGEMHKLSGTVKVSGEKAYVPQSPWILTGDVRENILFGKPYESDKYNRTIEACALIKDFELFAAGDLTEIGERGINMSGGQKQRIQIARAVYQDAEIYLLDDPFSAVDAHTGSQLFKDCLMGILKDKTILYVTHQVEFLPAADLILVMQNGKIAQSGTFDELLKQNIGFEVLVGAHSDALESVMTMESSSRTSEFAAVENELDADAIMNQEFPHTKQDSEHNLDIEITEREGRLVQDEEREKGSIGREVYMAYLTTLKGGALVPIIILAQSSFQVLQVLSNYWMAWACPTGDDELVDGMNFILLVYTLLAVGSAFCVLLRASLVAIAGLHTAEKLFSNMLNSVLRAPMAFFDSTPTGRILNRLLGTIAVMSQVAWEVFVIFIPVTAICIWYQRYYIPTARELARLAGIERTPILHHFAESLTGAATIRAFDQQERFTDANLCLIDNHSRPWFHNVSAMEWLSFRLNQLANFVFAFSLVLLVTLPEGVINPSIAGLAVTYGINLNVQQASVIWNICNAENKMISVERILQYSNLTSEAPLVIEDSRPPSNWPDFGTICFTNLQIRYAEHLPSVLKNISCTFPGRKKVGVVGRTGSGKSTLIQAIFRVVEAREGSIVIDDVDISKIGLHDLRSRLSIIPQDPTMFEGTVRGNLDPLEQHSDNEIWEALDKCQLGDIVRQKPDKLETAVVENGENWSVGQRQLFCLGRALLKKSSILVLDEATASVDSATDGAIQKIISQEFEDRTVVTIAHRIHTVIDSDLVLVLSDGRIAEYDSPAKLLERENSFFSKLIKEYSMRSHGFNGVPKLQH